MNKIKILFYLIIFLLGGRFAYAEIIVTEIAWMGTSNSANDEWIEIYNSGSNSINLSGWQLSSVDGTPSINLSGNIGPGEYKLLERTDDTTFPGIPALVIFTGALSNEGENLELLNSGNIVQSLDFSSGWPAGDASSKDTMQWNGSSWVTAPESAGGPTTYSGEDGNNNDDEDDGEDENDDGNDEEGDNEEEDDSDDTEVVSKSSSKEDNFILKRKRYEDRIFEAKVQKIAIVGDPTFFTAQALDFDRSDLHKGVYIWNMGDGVIREYSRKMNDGKQDFYHTYKYPGTYAVSLKYYETYFEGVSPDIEETFNIEVIEPKVSIKDVKLDGSIELKNVSSSTVDLTDWILKDVNGDTFIFPSGSMILSNKTIVLQNRATRLKPFSGVYLMTPDKNIISSWFFKDTFYSSINIKKTQKSVYEEDDKSNEQEQENNGEVLGSFSVNEEVDEDYKEKTNSKLVYILVFIIMVLVTIVGVLLLQVRKDVKEKEEEEYELIEE